MSVILTFKFRVKDSSARRHLSRYAVACNQVWNFCVATQREAWRRRRAGQNAMWPSAYDLIKLCTGSSGMLGLHSDTVSAICRQFARSRDAKRGNLRFRTSKGANRSLGWIPFIPRAVRIDGDRVSYLKRQYRFWKSRDIPDEAFKTGCFVEDARGRWYVTFGCEVPDTQPLGNGQVGIDLGLKVMATLSDGTTVPALQHYRRYEGALAKAQRAGNKRRVRAIHAKIANARKHQIHEATTRIARENALIVVGNVSSTKLVKTKMAKSVLDASWGMLRSQLRYKARRHGARYVEADEAWTSATCSSCHARSGPKGIAGLRIREWACSECGAIHDRDKNAALNILATGAECRPPAEGTHAL